MKLGSHGAILVNEGNLLFNEIKRRHHYTIIEGLEELSELLQGFWVFFVGEFELLGEDQFEEGDGGVDVAQVFQGFGFDVRAGFVDVLHVVPHVEPHHLTKFFLNIWVKLHQHLPQLQVLFQLTNQHNKAVTRKELLPLVDNLLADDFELVLEGLDVHLGLLQSVFGLVFHYGQAHVVGLELSGLVEEGPEEDVVETVDVGWGDADRQVGGWFDGQF